MNSAPRRATVRALAKTNLTLKVLHRRPDGFHELRTIFQTISLADRLDIEFIPGARTEIAIDCRRDLATEDNLAVRAARAVMDAAGAAGRVSLRLDKRIPLGGGLGGGSSDAAAVLLALPVLAGFELPLPELIALGAGLGSDVPFFLLGGAALGIGRGTDLCPLPEMPLMWGLMVMPAVHVSTAEAYAALGRELTSAPDFNSMNVLQALSWSFGEGLTARSWAASAENDFEGFVFERYPLLGDIRRRLRELGASPVLLSGSGASVYGIFRDRHEARRARAAFHDQQAESFYLVSRARYRRMWQRSLMGHLSEESWPPRSRYVR